MIISSPHNMIQTVADQIGRVVAVPQQPQRIISLVPSQTELLFHLGVGDAVVGRTRYCIHPAEQVQRVRSIGGTKKYRFDVIDQLQPDLIIGNKEENDEAGIRQLAASYPVWISDIMTLSDALAMICQVGQLVNAVDKAEQLAADIAARFAQLPRRQRPFRVAYFIWQKPFMVVAAQTFIHDVLTRWGCVNAFAEEGNGRYPVVTSEQIHAANLDAILLSSEPFPFTEKHQQAFMAQFPGIPVHLIDGEMLSWYGSRLLLTVDYLRHFDLP